MIIIILFMSKVSILSHLLVPKILFFFHLDPFHVINSLLSHSTFANLGVFLFFFFQVDTIPNFFEVAFFSFILRK